MERLTAMNVCFLERREEEDDRLMGSVCLHGPAQLGRLLFFFFFFSVFLLYLMLSKRFKIHSKHVIRI
jgi:hypothetical protein